MAAQGEVFLEWAENMLAELKVNGHRPEPGLAMPFGVPEPERWRWRVAVDVRAALLALSKANGAVDWIPSDDAPLSFTERLFGIELTVDADIGEHTIALDERL
jgi:hypothetical protein